MEEPAVASRLPFPPSRLELLSEHRVRGDDPSGDSCPGTVHCGSGSRSPASHWLVHLSPNASTEVLAPGAPRMFRRQVSVREGWMALTLPAPPASGRLQGPGGGASVRGQWGAAVGAAGPGPGKRPLRLEGVRGTSRCLSRRWVSSATMETRAGSVWPVSC